MSFQEYIPPPLLNPYIDTFWVSANDGITASKILPDGCVDIVFDCGDDSNSFSDDSIRISGMMTKYKQVVSKQDSETFGIRFKTGLFSSISNFPLSEIKNKTIHASEVLPDLNALFLDELLNKKNRIDKIRFLEEFLKNQLYFANNHKNDLILSVCASIRSSFQAINLVQIAQQHHISLRQLERGFKMIVGVTMKEYHTIVRFTKTMESISKYPEKSLLHTAFDNGYFDHAHLTKNVRKMAGINPSQI
ncbi:AraC family transcriptional regulator [Flavivirga eckloniae]|uniref:HTH araC/xylS-type domain-containing protein n=1 Tax=Flavivirga eckloniae TaxID=1803846 RepID=A0A2K9PN99_9FLAO|nr:helix-turn-helix domain-containing protein [Flavivirga eckloniae]AUP78506.1 hypothetical protein C1H87_07195 [Flavivirga eckloniae]